MSKFNLDGTDGGGNHADNGGKYTTKRNNRLIDGGKEESFAGRLSRAEDEGDNGDKDVAKMHNERGAHECARRNAINKGESEQKSPRDWPRAWNNGS